MPQATTQCLQTVLFAALLVWASSVAMAADLSIASPAFDNGQPIPEKYSCDGAGVSPPLEVADVPNQAKSLALIVDDPDAPAGDWTHWVVYNLAPNLAMLAPAASGHDLPGPASTADNSWHKPGYGGVCPPRGNGMHHYHFSLYALNARLPDDLRDKAAVDKAMQGHIIGKAELIGTYRRN